MLLTNRLDQVCLGRSHETMVTLRRGETLLSSADYSSGDGPLLVLGDLLLYRQFFCLGSLLCCLTSIIGYPVAYVLPSLTGLLYLTYCMILCSIETVASLKLHSSTRFGADHHTCLVSIKSGSCRHCSGDNGFVMMASLYTQASSLDPQVASRAKPFAHSENN